MKINRVYKLLKKAIQKANPEIMELKFGCRVSFNRGHGIEYGTYLSYENIFDVVHPDDYQYGIYQVTNEKFKILGRPIRLADVLLAARGVTSLYLNADGIFCKKHPELHSIGAWTYKGEPVLWNLRDDNLNHQSDKTKQFLIDLLV